MMTLALWATLGPSWPAPDEQRIGRGSRVVVVQIDEQHRDSWEWRAVVIDEYGRLTTVQVNTLIFDIPKDES